MEEGIYDLVMSNIPFGTVKVYDYSYQKGNAIKMMATNTLHNYFFVKGLDAVKEGGLVVYITTVSYTHLLECNVVALVHT